MTFVRVVPLPPLPLRPGRYVVMPERPVQVLPIAAAVAEAAAARTSPVLLHQSAPPPRPMSPGQYANSGRPLPVVGRVEAADPATPTPLVAPSHMPFRPDPALPFGGGESVRPRPSAEGDVTLRRAPVRASADAASRGDNAWSQLSIGIEPPQRPTPSLAGDRDRVAPQAQRRPMLLVVRLLKIAAGVVAAYLALILVLLVAYRFVDPPISSLMAQKLIFGEEVTQVWVPLERISPDVVHAVLVSEDGRFCEHNGVDFEEIQNAIERAGDDGVPRGASTISMQVIKNLFLWPSRSYLRKVIEFPLTYLMELLWPKRRIMEIYLNIAEWGPGVFGVEAASQFHFNKGAAQLNEREAARLAVALPNPLLRDAGAPGPRTRRLASDIEARARAAGSSQTACVDVPRRAAVKSVAPKPAFRDPAANWQPSVRRD